MAVPTGSGCTLLAVKSHMEGSGSSTITSLSVAFAQSNSYGFDGAYALAGDSLWEFQNYEHTTTSTSTTSGYASFSISATGNVTNIGTCTLGTSGTAYHDGIGTYPDTGDNIFDDAGGTPFSGTDQRYWLMANDDSIYIDGGEVLGVQACTEMLFPFDMPDKTDSETSPEDACEVLPIDVTYFHDGVGADPTIGDYIYEDAEGTTPLNLPNEWLVTDGGLAVQIATDGEVVDEFICD